jgi:hypothetical protein
MFNSKIGWLLTAGVAALAAFGSFAVFPPAASAQDGSATLRIVAPTEEVKEGDESVPVQIILDNVSNLGGFQFVLQYDGDVFEFQQEQRGDFLGSTGREVVCNDPLSDVGSVRIECVTLRPTPEGASGSGTLSTVLLKAKGSGDVQFTLDRIKLIAADETGTVIPSTGETASLNVKGDSGMNWLIWGPVIGLGGLLVAGIVTFAVSRMRSAGSKPAVAS